MLFNSYEFVLLFLPLSIGGYFLLGRWKQYKITNIFLLFISIFFYIQFNWKFVPIIGLSILANYSWSMVLQKHPKKVNVFLGVLFNIGVLAYFKYTNFFIENMNTFFQSDIALMKILVPVGISFFTFQQISFIVDTYKKPKIKYPFVEYALHIIFFGYIISGPIMRHNQMIPQFLDQKRKNFNSENFAKGLMAFSIGLAKKVWIADTFALAANWGYDNIYGLNTTSAFFVMLAYTLQIYFDFSGYSDMVTGIGKMFNFDISINFNSPYKALDISDFWKRWHMTLTRFFTDYIYIPLGGNRRGKIITYVNIGIVFLVSGFWHGASWTFIVWGCLHGVLSILNHIFKKQIKRVNPILSWVITFLLVNVAWIFFRADTLGDAIHIIKVLATFQFGALPYEFSSVFILPEFSFILQFLPFTSDFIPGMICGAFFIISLMAILQGKNTNERIENFHPSVKNALFLGLILAWMILSFSNITSFIYVNF